MVRRLRDIGNRSLCEPPEGIGFSKTHDGTDLEPLQGKASWLSGILLHVTLREDTEKADEEYREALKKQVDECKAEEIREVVARLAAIHKAKIVSLFDSYLATLPTQ